MRQLEALEQKIALVIQKTKDLQVENSALRKENSALKEQCTKLEASLLKEAGTMAALATEKNAIKNSIDELLHALGSLEASER